MFRQLSDKTGRKPVGSGPWKPAGEAGKKQAMDVGSAGSAPLNTDWHSSEFCPHTRWGKAWALDKVMSQVKLSGLTSVWGQKNAGSSGCLFICAGWRECWTKIQIVQSFAAWPSGPFLSVLLFICPGQYKALVSKESRVAEQIRIS